MSSLSPLPLGGVSVQLAGRRRHRLGAGSEPEVVVTAGQMPVEMEGARRRRRSRRAGQAVMEGARRRHRSRRAGQAEMEGARRRRRSRRAGQDAASTAGRRHKSRKH